MLSDVFHDDLPPRFEHEGPGRRKAMEAAWKASDEREQLVAGMSEAEKKRRRY